MANSKYRLFDLGLDISVHLLPALGTPELRAIGDFFDRNMKRVKSLSIFPPMVVNTITMGHRIDTECLFKLTGKPYYIGSEHPRFRDFQACVEATWKHVAENIQPEHTFHN